MRTFEAPRGARQIRVIRIANGYLVLAEANELAMEGDRYAALSAAQVGELVADLASNFLLEKAATRAVEGAASAS